MSANSNDAIEPHGRTISHAHAGVAEQEDVLDKNPVLVIEWGFDSPRHHSCKAL